MWRKAGVAVLLSACLGGILLAGGQYVPVEPQYAHVYACDTRPAVLLFTNGSWEPAEELVIFFDKVVTLKTEQISVIVGRGAIGRIWPSAGIGKFFKIYFEPSLQSWGVVEVKVIPCDAKVIKALWITN